MGGSWEGVHWEIWPGGQGPGAIYFLLATWFAGASRVPPETSPPGSSEPSLEFGCALELKISGQLLLLPQSFWRF